ncbi:hypothetical protein SNE40_004009 [Patella caerulea]|uniref:Uncharacterized protein n=1 Tax=Patella caerulea TaxID=87958 RepID=A0AAN8QG44_PATCE
MIWCSQGNNKIWFIWKIPHNHGQRDINKSLEISKEIEDKHIEHYHSRVMRQKFVEHYDRIILNPKKCSSATVLEEIYQDLTGDMSASPTIEHKEVRNRLRVYLDAGIENPDIAVDLREINSGQPRKYDVFFEAVENFIISERTLNAAHERRHDEIGRLAVAISIRDLITQVSKTLDSSVPVPSESYLRLQFWPKNKHYHTALHYTGRFNLRYQIQTRQLRGEHVDLHYANTVFRHLREFLIKFREQGTFLSIDDKCHVKVGEPGSPVAFVPRGRQMIVHGDGQAFTATDHDFTKFKLVPSAVLLTDIPKDIGGSFYQGNLQVILKDQVFETSKPFRHAAELNKILELKFVTPIVAIYSDGGPDHRITYLSVQLSLIALFVNLDLDMLVAARTAPLQSFRNPVERCMATLNLGLQFVSISRAKMDDEAEKAIKKSSTLKALRDVAEKKPQDLKDKMKQSVHKPIGLLESVFERLQYTSQPVCTTGSASEEEISKITQAVLDLDPNIDVNKL